MTQKFSLDEFDSAETIAEGKVRVYVDDEIDESGELEEIDDEEIDPNEETLRLDTDDDLLEFEDPIPVPAKPRPQSAPKRSRAVVDVDDESDEFEIYTSDPCTAYVTRWFAAQLGFMAALCAYAGVQWAQLDYAWTYILQGSQIPLIEQYITIAGCVWLVAIIIAAVLAKFDRSAIRCFQLGIAWAAIAIISVTALSVRQPAHIAQVSKDDRVHVTAAMLQIALAPAIHAYEYERRFIDAD